MLSGGTCAGTDPHEGRGMALGGVQRPAGAKRAEPGGRNPAVSVFQLPGQRLCGRPHVPVLKTLQRRMAYERLSMDAPLRAAPSRASLEYYQEDERVYRQMEKVFRACQSYGEKLRPDSPSMLFRGGTAWEKPTCPWPLRERPLKRAWGDIRLCPKLCCGPGKGTL